MIATPTTAVKAGQAAWHDIHFLPSNMEPDGGIGGPCCHLSPRSHFSQTYLLDSPEHHLPLPLRHGLLDQKGAQTVSHPHAIFMQTVKPPLDALYIVSQLKPLGPPVSLYLLSHVEGHKCSYS